MDYAAQSMNDTARSGPIGGFLGGVSLQLERVDVGRHVLAERVVDELMLGDEGFAFERGRDDRRGEMVLVVHAAGLGNGYVALGEFSFDESCNVLVIHARR